MNNETKQVLEELKDEEAKELQAKIEKSMNEHSATFYVHQVIVDGKIGAQLMLMKKVDAPSEEPKVESPYVETTADTAPEGEKSAD